jgi:hypothetical protein
MIGLLSISLLISGCGGSAVKLAPIAGKWTHQSNQSQVWAYEFPSDEVVRFSIDNQRQQWPIQEIRVAGSNIEIDVNAVLGRGGGNSTIRIQKLGNDAIVVSSGLHPGIPFKKS